MEEIGGKRGRLWPDFCVVCNVGVSVCEGASGRSGPNGGRRTSARRHPGKATGGNCAVTKFVGAATGLRKQRVLDDTPGAVACHSRFFSLPRTGCLHLKGVGVRPAERRIRHGSLHPGAVLAG